MIMQTHSADDAAARRMRERVVRRRAMPVVHEQVATRDQAEANRYWSAIVETGGGIANAVIEVLRRGVRPARMMRPWTPGKRGGRQIRWSAVTVADRWQCTQIGDLSALPPLFTLQSRSRKSHTPARLGS